MTKFENAGLPARANPPIRLYSYAMSPYAAKVHCFLLYKQLDFECYYINPLRVSAELPVGKQIPVLTIDGESRADSTPIGLWLDERFPEHRSLLPSSPDERQQLLELDQWISHYVIPRTFRYYPGRGLRRLQNGWLLGHVMSQTARGGLPWLLRATWPLLIYQASFVRQLVASAQDGRSDDESKRALFSEFAERLDGGPFLLGRTHPSLPDFSAYPQFALFYAMGFLGGDDVTRSTEIMSWMRQLAPFLNGQPALLPDAVQTRPFPS